MSDLDKKFVQKHATTIAFADSLGQEIHRTAGFENAILGIQLREKLGYVAQRFEPWVRAAWIPEVPLGLAMNFSTILFPEMRELAEDGLPRWHHLDLRFQRALNERLAREEK